MMKKFLAALTTLFACSTLQAATLQIIDLPTNATTDGTNLVHNTFHDSSRRGGTEGTILAWFDLGAGGGSYDTVTGAFNVNIDLYTDQTLTSFVATAVGSGNLTAAEFNGDNGGLIGTIDWTFDAAATAYNPMLTNTRMDFIDVFYAQTAAGHIANTLLPSHMTMWGSDCGLLEFGTPQQSAGRCADFVPNLETPQSLGLGVDFVATFVPVPAAIWLFGSGLLALVGISRRRARHS